MIYVSAVTLGFFIISGLYVLSGTLEKIAIQMSRANDLKQAELKSQGVEVPSSEDKR